VNMPPNCQVWTLRVLQRWVQHRCMSKYALDWVERMVERLLGQEAMDEQFEGAPDCDGNAMYAVRVGRVAPRVIFDAGETDRRTMINMK